MKCHCSDRCKRNDFPIKLLYNNSIYTCWREDRKRYISILNTDVNGKAKQTKRYIAKHKTQGLAKCKICVYITAQPTKPGTKCMCCNATLSQSIREPNQAGKEKHRRQLEQQQQEEERRNIEA